MLSENPSVSVIIPIYNGEDHIGTICRCLEQQTFHDFELIFVDDGSSDRSPQILDSYVRSDTPFPCRVIHQENGGVSSARNRGRQEASGQYICYIDADDIISDDYLELLFQAVSMDGIRVAVGHISLTESDLAKRDSVHTVTKTSSEFLRDFLYRGIHYSICACMIDKACYAEYGLTFPEGEKYSEDVYLLWQLFAREPKIAETDAVIYYYYNNPDSAMHATVDLNRKGAIALMEKLEPIIRKYNPDFSKEFDQFAVSRHHWSILWQAALFYNSYKSFMEFCSHFPMKEQLKKLYTYPEKRISWSSRLYVCLPYAYYVGIRLYVKIFK